MHELEFQNKVEELIYKLPILCGARESWGRSGLLQYHDELNNPQFYERVEGESFEDRCESYAAFVDHAADRDKAFYGLGLLALIDANHKRNEISAAGLREQLSALSGNYPDVDKIITFDEASVQTFWAP